MQQETKPEITPDQLEDWLSHPVTTFFRRHLEEVKKELRAEPRYTPGFHVTSDMCALHNAYIDGTLQGLDELNNFKTEMLEDGEEDNQT